jgi:hypothetical protein
MCMRVIIGATKQDVLHAVLTSGLNMVFNMDTYIEGGKK